MHDCGNRNQQPTVWTGEWPGILECREFGWYTDPESVWGETEDLNRLYTSREVVWSVEQERFIRT